VLERFKGLIPVTTFGCLRWGGVSTLQRLNLDAEAGWVRHSFAERRGVGLGLGPPKSRAGRRTVSLHPWVLPAIRRHLESIVDNDPDAVVFTGPDGATTWRGNPNKLIDWRATVAALGVPGLRFHSATAMVHQHATSTADRAIADAVDKAVPAAHDQLEEPRQRRNDPVGAVATGESARLGRWQR